MILGKLDRSSTLLHGETGYLRHDLPVILTVISGREAPEAEQGGTKD